LQVGQDFWHLEHRGELAHPAENPAAIELRVAIHNRFNVKEIAPTVGNCFHDNQVFWCRNSDNHALTDDRLRPGNDLLLKWHPRESNVNIRFGWYVPHQKHAPLPGKVKRV